MKSKINIPKAFFSFLIASFFIWLLINLSKEYHTVIRYNVAYKKLPQHKVFQEEPLKKIDVKVKATGFKLFSSNFYNKDLIFYVDKIRYNAKKQYYILAEDQNKIVQKQLYKGLRLEEILQDTIFLKLGSLLSKKVPVVANVKINYEHGYDLVSPIQPIPDSVLISGPKLQIDQIEHIQTSLLTLNNVSKDVESVLKIEKPKDFDKVKVPVQDVKIKIAVDKFTEGEFLVPFTIDNLPAGIKINTYPKQIKVIYKIGLSNFNKVTSNSFKVVCDYKLSKENEIPYLLPRLVAKPNVITSVRLDPTKVEYLIEE